jgi:hypothetical protein
LPIELHPFLLYLHVSIGHVSGSDQVTIVFNQSITVCLRLLISL